MLNNTQEAYALMAVLDNLDPDEHRYVADGIVGALIETGLFDCDRAPQALRVWMDEPDGEKANDDILAIYGVY